ncbi:two-component system sensor histidine kinase ChvG [Aminobacter sp. J44]|nr:two-component system sensor histidine kinase ChvG [Aminobacter sp. J44]
MTDTSRTGPASARAGTTGGFRRWGRLLPFRRVLGHYVFSSLTRRILFLNLAALCVMVVGILYINQFRDGLVQARIDSLMTQGEIIAGAIAASATVETDAITIDPEKLLELQAGESLPPGTNNLDLQFPINPERVAPVLRRLISPTLTRARIFDRDASLLLDSRHLYSRGQILRYSLPPVADEEVGVLKRIEKFIIGLFQRSNLPVYHEQPGGSGTAYPEVMSALQGSAATMVRVSEQGEQIVSVAVPIQRFRAVLGALMLSTQGGDIDKIVAAERSAILRVFGVAALVVTILSMLLASTIANPSRSRAARRQEPRGNTRLLRPPGRDRQPFRRAARHDQCPLRAHRGDRELCCRRFA